ncbi:hypothetical protein [Rhizobium sp. CNPSo 4039]|uniref:hypothetical protein n=1 Tax=Rhizobium sp. CNPSo 4039 TaxID=3021409 RepID=UPI00254D964D|nr:hypothetical protein [Rhizobium sp. CNPSo 4039]MDK4711592.1 hypothetical protein [Rhizobium sp. CNPSo 4039]
MSKGRSETEDQARQLFRDQRNILDLIKEPKSRSGFEPAIHHLFGDKRQRGKTARIVNHEFLFSGVKKDLVSFLPVNWRKELDKINVTWRGCENWWLGYPFVALMELKVSDDGIKGHLKLNAEVGPLSEHNVRKRIIVTITQAALAKNFDRIQFPADALDKGRLYSRFLRRNSIAVNDIRDTDEMEKKFEQLIADFEPEFDLVASLIPELSDELP